MTKVKISRYGNSTWVRIYDRYWKFLATCALLLLTLQVGINGYRAGTDWQRVELEKAKIILQYTLMPKEDRPLTLVPNSERL